MAEAVSVERNRELPGLIFRSREARFSLVLLHAFNRSPDDLKPLALHLAERGVAVISPKYSDAADGVNQAIKSARYAKGVLGFSSERVGIAGISLGGTVSILAATQERVGFVGDYGGWVDMAALYQYLSAFPKGTPQREIADTMRAAVGTPQESPEVYSYSSPITYVEMIDAPVLIIHGEKDDMVPLEQSRTLYERLKALGKDVELYILPEAGYLFRGVEKEIARLTVEFLEKRGKL